ncbi:hypothetical protein B296_00046782, partial [Ensete ventricosum]
APSPRAERLPASEKKQPRARTARGQGHSVQSGLLHNPKVCHVQSNDFLVFCSYLKGHLELHTLLSSGYAEDQYEIPKKLHHHKMHSVA